MSYSTFVILILWKIFASPLGKLSTEFTSAITKSTSPRLSDMTFFAPCAYKKLLVREQRESLSARNSKKNAHQLFYGRMHYWHKVLVTEGCPPPPQKKEKIIESFWAGGLRFTLFKCTHHWSFWVFLVGSSISFYMYIIHCIPKWVPFRFSFVYLRISPYCLVLKLKMRQQGLICK